MAGGTRGKVPDGGWGWMCVLGAVLTHVVFGIMVRAFGVTYLEMLQRYEGGAMATGWVGAINMTAAGLFGPLTTSLCVRFGARLVVIVGSVILCIGIILTGLAPNLPVTYITYGFIAGLGLSMTYTPGYLSVGEYFDKRKALAMAVCNFGTGFGTLIFPPLILYFFLHYGYEGAFLLLGGISLNCCVSAALFRPLEPSKQRNIDSFENQESRDIELVETKDQITKENDVALEENNTNNDVTVPDDVQHGEDGKSKEKALSKEQAKKGLASVFDVRLLADRRFMCMCLVVFSCAFALALTSGFLPALAIEKGIGDTKAAFLLSISGISSTVGGLGIGIPLDMKKVRPHRVKLYGVFAFMVGVATVLNPLVTTYVGFLLLTFMRAGFAGVVIGQRATLAADLVGPKRVPNAFGWLLFAHSLGSLIGRASGGTLKEVLGSYDASFYMSGGVSIVACLIYMIGTMDRSCTSKRQTAT